MKLIRRVEKCVPCGRKAAREHIAARRVAVDGVVCTDPTREVDSFTTITLVDRVIQQRERICIALHKPAGVVSATTDVEHRTVIDLLPEQWEPLHLAGRLDKETTGLVILTNDGHFSEAITESDRDVGKVYEVTLRDDLDEPAIDAFRQGIYFAYEDITTAPCEVEMLAARRVRLTLYEGRYHQVKRMFHAIGNRVVALHRTRVGPIALGELAPGAWRHLTKDEVAQVLG